MARRVRKSRADNKRWDNMVSALRTMNFAFNNVRLYPPTHAEVTSVVDKLHETLTPILEEQEDMGFGFMDQLLYIEGAVSLEETASNQMLVDRFSKCRVEYLMFMKGLAKDDLLTFFQILNAEATKPTTEHHAELLENKGVKTIHIVEADVDDVRSKSKVAKKKTLFDWYGKAAAALKTVEEGYRGGWPVDLKPLHRVIDEMMATIRNKGFDPFLLLPLLGRDMDPHHTHAVNVSLLCCALGDLYGLNSGQINTLCLCAMLHDMGRLVIPIEWTQDKEPLSAEYRSVARQHGDWGFLLLNKTSDLPLNVPLLAAMHHENHGGTGEGEYKPDVFHRILSLADAYDLSMVSDRYYWRKHRQDRMLAKLLNSRGVGRDPILLKLLSLCVGLYPVGSQVQLEDGRKGIVVRPNLGHPLRPKLFLYEESVPLPEDLPPGEEPPPVILDTSEIAENGLSFKTTIARLLAPHPQTRELLDKKKEYLLSYGL